MKASVVFGGSGFIGRHLVEALRAQGRRVVVADLVAPTHATPDVEFWSCDVRRPVTRHLDADEVFNLAAVHRTPGHPDHEYYDTNVGGALNITRWAADVGVTRLCFTSSISVYGPSESAKTEDSELCPTSAYGRSKLLAEQIHAQWVAADPSRRLAIARPAVVFGPGERGNFTRLAEALRRRRFVYPGRRDTIKACGHVGDLVRALQAGLDLADPMFTFNYCYPAPVTIEQICDAFGVVAGYPAPPALPMPLMRSALAVLSGVPGGDGRAWDPDRVRKLLGSTHIVPAALREAGFTWETDLVTGLERWRDAEPIGRFV